MFERFTDRARRVVALAQEEARLLNHDYIGTEHLLLGLVHEGEGVAAQALQSLGISLSGVREQVEDSIGRGNQYPTGHIPFTPRAKQVLERSWHEARLLNHDYIGTEHLLLGLIREQYDGVAAHVLIKLGADLNQARVAVLRLVGATDAPPREELMTEPRCVTKIMLPEGVEVIVTGLSTDCGHNAVLDTLDAAAEKLAKS